MQDSFHKYNRKLERTLQSIKEQAFSNGNGQSILDFVDHCFSEGLSVARVEKYAGHLKQIALAMDTDFRSATRKDIERFIHSIHVSDYSEWTKRDFRITLKKFYRWLRDSERDPPEVAWLRSDVKNHRRKLPEELLDEKDVQMMIDACGNSRDRALISTIYESGCRIGEVASLKIKHVVPYSYGFRLIVNGKTGSRRILTVSSAPYLKEWINEHPRKHDPQSYLWITRDYRNARMCYNSIGSILSGAAWRAGIKKKVNPHSFRHSRATRLANSLTEAQMNAFFGWVQGSDMPSVYVHLSGRDVDQALLKTYGIETDKESDTKSKFLPKTCQRCSVQNAPTNKFCSRCGTILDKEEAGALLKQELDRDKADGIMDRLIGDSEFREMLQRKLKEMSTSDT